MIFLLMQDMNMEKYGEKFHICFIGGKWREGEGNKGEESQIRK